MKKVILALIVVGLASCMTPQKATSYLKKKNLLADTCAANFPVKERVVTRDTTYYDTLYVDTPYEFYLDFVKETLPNDTNNCEPIIRTVYITKTVQHDSVIYQRDTAYETVLIKQNYEAQKKLTDMETLLLVKEEKILEQKTEIRDLKRLKVKMWLLVALLVVVIFRKQIFSIIGNLINPVKNFYPF